MNKTDDNSNKSRLEKIEENIEYCNNFYSPIETKEWLVSAVSKDDVLFLLALAKSSSKEE